MTADDARPGPTALRTVLVVVAGLVTAALFVGTLLVTGFLACGVSSCSGGGFGPVYAPVQAQVGLLVAGLTLLPLVLWLLRRSPRPVQAGVGLAAVLVGAVVAMVLLDLGPNGCPGGQTRATAGPEAVEPGSATCSRDPDAVPRR